MCSDHYSPSYSWMFVIIYLFLFLFCVSVSLCKMYNNSYEERKKNTNKNNNHNNKKFWNTQCTTYHIILIVNRMDDCSDCAIFHDWLNGCLFQAFTPNMPLTLVASFGYRYIVVYRMRLWGKYTKYECVMCSVEWVYTQMNALHCLSTVWCSSLWFVELECHL